VRSGTAPPGAVPPAAVPPGAVPPAAVPPGAVPPGTVPPGGLPASPTRRAVLAASAGAVPLLLAGCKGVQALGKPPPPPGDVRALRAAISAEQLMVARYQAALTVAVGSPAVHTALGSVLAEHSQHLDQLASRLIEPSTSGSASPGRRGRPGSLPSGLPATVRLLEGSELAASDRLLAGLLAVPPSLAQLFASIAASEATHVPLLRSLRPVR
jgi:hypothetical protein